MIVHLIVVVKQQLILKLLLCIDYQFVSALSSSINQSNQSIGHTVINLEANQGIERLERQDKTKMALCSTFAKLDIHTDLRFLYYTMLLYLNTQINVLVHLFGFVAYIGFFSVKKITDCCEGASPKMVPNHVLPNFLYFI